MYFPPSFRAATNPSHAGRRATPISRGRREGQPGHSPAPHLPQDPGRGDPALGDAALPPHPCPAVGPARDLGGQTPSGSVFHCAAAPQGCLGGLPWHSDDGHSYLRRPGRPPVADAGGGDKAWQFHALKVVLCKSAPLSHPPPPSLCTLITQAPQRRSWFDLNSRRGWELGVGMCVFIFPLHPLGPVAEGEGWGGGAEEGETSFIC